jgi:hypothetical protein
MPDRLLNLKILNAKIEKTKFKRVYTNHTSECVYTFLSLLMAMIRERFIGTKCTPQGVEQKPVLSDRSVHTAAGSWIEPDQPIHNPTRTYGLFSVHSAKILVLFHEPMITLSCDWAHQKLQVRYVDTNENYPRNE